MQFPDHSPIKQRFPEGGASSGWTRITHIKLVECQQIARLFEVLCTKNGMVICSVNNLLSPEY